MPGVVDTLRVVYQIDVVDRGTKQLLASERAAQKSVLQTSRILAQQDAAKKRSSAVTTSASTRNAAAVTREAKAAQTAAAGTQRLTAAQSSSASTTRSAAGLSVKAAAAYDTQTAALKRLTVAERAYTSTARGAHAARAMAPRVVARTSTSLGGAASAGAVAGRSVRGVGGGALVGAVGLGAALSQTIKFDKAMRNVNSIAQLGEERFVALSKAVRGLAGETAQAPQTLAEGLYDLVSSGFDAKESLIILRQSAKAATAGLTDSATSTKAVAAVLNAYQRPATDAANVSDTLFQTVNKGVISFEQLSSSIGDVLPFASSLGVGLDQVGASISTMTKAGIGPEETMTRIKNVMVTMLKPGEGLTNALKKLGVESGEALIKQKGFQGALEAAISTTDGSKAAIAGLFPNIRALGGALALTGKNAKGARADLASFANVSGATNTALAQQSKSLSYQWNSLKAQASGLAISVGGKLVPALGGALKAMNNLSRGRGGVGKWLKEFGAGVKNVAVRPRQVAVGERALSSARTTAGAPSVANVSAARKAGDQARIALAKLGDTARRIGPVLLGAGRQLLDAFKPATPFLRNVLLPLLKGLAKGVIASVVVAFKIAVPVIKVAASALGLVGKAARPLRGAIEAIGGVIGFLVAGPILGLLSKLPKVGIVFKLLLAPIRLVSGAVRGVLGWFGKLPGGMAAKATSAVGRVIDVFAKLPGRIGGLISSVAKAFGRFGKSIVTAIVGAIRGAPGRIIDALKSLVPGPLRGLAKKIPGNPFRFRHGGRVRRYQDGGLVPIVASGGEMMVHGNHAAMIPGPSDRDGTPMLAPAGAAILTADGQARMSMGASLAEAVRSQAPHFAKGGTVKAGKYVSTAYGPPWNKMNGTGVTRTGVDLRPAKKRYGIAVDPSMIPLGTNVYARPNPFGRSGPFKAFDTGGAIKGRRIDFYDWRGRKTQQAWGKRPVTISRSATGGGSSSSAARRKALEKQIERNMDRLDELRNQSAAITGTGAADKRRPIQAQIRKLVSANRKLRAQIRDLPKDSESDKPTILGKSRRRAGLLGDAFAQGQAEGQAGLTLGAIKREGNPVLRAIAEAIRGAGTQPDKGGGARGSSQGDAGGGASGGGSRIDRMRATASAIDKKRYQYAWGGGHGRIGVPTVGSRTPRGGKRGLGYDCSGAVSAVLGAAALLKTPLTSGGLMSWGRKGPGKNLAVHTDPGHVIMRIGRRFWGTGEQNPNGGAGWLSSNTMRGRGVVRSWPGLRSGGIVGRFRTGGFTSIGTTPRGATSNGPGSQLTGAVATAMRFVGGSLEVLDNIIARSLETRLAALRGQLQRRVAKGGPAKVVQRLQGVIDMIDFELGRRVGRIQDVVEQRTTAMERRRGTVERMIRASGAPAESSRAIGVMAAMQAAETKVRQQNVAGLQRALQTATRARNRAAIREITQQLHEAQDALHESMVRQVELWRDQIRALGSEAVAHSQFGLGWNQTTMGLVETHQRQYGYQDTPRAMTERAQYLQTAIAPMLEASRAAHLYNAQMLAGIGDVDGWRQAMQDAHSTTLELANAQADAADLMRDAVRRAAQDIVSASQFGLAWHQANMGDLEAHQRRFGYQDNPEGVRERADRISTGVIPALQAALEAHHANAQALASIGDIEGWRQAMLDARNATIDLMNAQTDAADLMREAAQKVVGAIVNRAQFEVSWEDQALERLELEQRLIGTHDTPGGAAGRAEFIQSRIIPAIQAEIAALEQQRVLAEQQRDSDLVHQLWLQIFSKENELLRRQVDAQERTAENTDLLKTMGGSTAFSYRDTLYTDDHADVIRARLGA